MCSSWREFRRESCNASKQVYIYTNYTPKERAQIGNLRPRERQYLRARATAVWEDGVSSEITESLEWQTALTVLSLLEVKWVCGAAEAAITDTAVQLCALLQSKGIRRRNTLVFCLWFCETGCCSDEPFVVVHIVRWFARQTSESVWTGHGTKPVLGFEMLVLTAHHKTAIKCQTDINYKIKWWKRKMGNRQTGNGQTEMVSTVSKRANGAYHFPFTHFETEQVNGTVFPRIKASSE